MIYVDTNILIYLLEGHEEHGEVVADLLESLTAQGESLMTSAITITEFLAGTRSSSLSTLHQVPRLQFITLDELLAEQAAKLQRKHSSLQIGDAIHLATAIQSQATLLFTNDKFLSKIASGYMEVKRLEND